MELEPAYVAAEPKGITGLVCSAGLSSGYGHGIGSGELPATPGECVSTPVELGVALPSPTGPSALADRGYACRATA